jgi:putative transcriptional regulator
MAKKTDFQAMTVAEQTREGLQDALAHARGELTLRTTILPGSPPRLSPAKIRALRTRRKTSQGVFASYLNVSPKTVQSWEQGTRVPKAGEARLLQIFGAIPDQVSEVILKSRRTA